MVLTPDPFDLSLLSNIPKHSMFNPRLNKPGKEHFKDILCSCHAEMILARPPSQAGAFL